MATIRQSSAAATIRDIAEQVVSDSSRTSIFQEETTTTADIQPGVTTGGVVIEPWGTGTGAAVTNGPVLSSTPAEIDNSVLTGRNSLASSIGTPTPPRCGTATPKFISGISGDAMRVYLQWAPPLVDTAGRWLQLGITDSSTGEATTEDGIGTYLIRRVDQDTGSTETVGAVAHSEQYIASAITYLEGASLATVSGSLVTFDSSALDSEGVVTLGSGHENYFYFIDATALYGHSYKYYIQAIALDQEESEELEITPTDATSDGTLDVQTGTTWLSSYPNTSEDGGVTSYADLSIITAGITTQVEVGLVPIQAGAYTIDVSANEDEEPYISYTTPAEVTLYHSADEELIQTVTFVGYFMENHGGIESITFGSGVTAKTPIATYLTKTQLTEGDTDAYQYSIPVVVATDAIERPITMTVVDKEGYTALCSTITVAQATTISSGVIFDATRYTFVANIYVNVTAKVTLTGEHLNRIESINLVQTVGTTTHTKAATISDQTHNALTITASGLWWGAWVVSITYKSPYVSDGNDKAYIAIGNKSVLARITYFLG